MKYSIIIDKEREEEIVIYARERSALVERLEAVIKEDVRDIFGYRGEEIVKLSKGEIVCATVEADRVFAITSDGKYQVKHRLYQMEELLGDDFIKINQSCIVKVSEIARFDTSLSGALKVTLKNGFKDYVSRRQLKTVKERIGI